MALSMRAKARRCAPPSTTAMFMRYAEFKGSDLGPLNHCQVQIGVLELRAE